MADICIKLHLKPQNWFTSILRLYIQFFYWLLQTCWKFFLLLNACINWYYNTIQFALYSFCWASLYTTNFFLKNDLILFLRRCQFLSIFSVSNLHLFRDTFQKLFLFASFGHCMLNLFGWRYLLSYHLIVSISENMLTHYFKVLSSLSFRNYF